MITKTVHRHIGHHQLALPDEVRVPQDMSTEELHALLTRWSHEGLLTTEQADRIEASEGAAHAGAERVERPTAFAERVNTSLVAEAFGYVGAALVAAAVSTMVGQFWEDMATGSRVALFAIPAILLFGLGRAVAARAGATAERLNAVSWTASAGMLAAAIGVGAAGWTEWASESVTLTTFAPTALYALYLWRQSQSVLLHLATFAALAATAASASKALDLLGDQSIQMGIYTVALMWTVLAYARYIEPRTVGMALASFVGIVAAQATIDVKWGVALALGTMAAVVLLAVVEANLVLLVVGAVGVFMTVPASMDKMFHGPMGVGLGLLIAGMVMLSAAVYVVRRQGAKVT